MNRFLTVLAIALLASSCSTAPNGDEVSTAAGLDGPTAAGPIFDSAPDQDDPLGDALPGLGLSNDNVERDETVSLYQAYQREVFVADCMAEAGFSYAPDVQYPPEIALAVLAASDAKDPQAVESLQAFDPDQPTMSLDRSGHRVPVVGWHDGTSWNQMVLEDARRAENGDAYTQTLYGESLSDLESQRGADDPEFATGGCDGDAWEKIPGIWVIRDEVKAESAAVIAPFQAAEFEKCRADHGFDARNLGDLEASAGDANRSDSERVDLARAFEDCLRRWDASGITARSSEEYQAFVDEAKAEYGFVAESQLEARDAAMKDEGFLRYLASINAGPIFDPVVVEEPSEYDDVDVVPLDAPDVERTSDVPPQQPPADELLMTMVEVLGLKSGPGQSDRYAQIVIEWDGVEFVAQASTSDIPVPEDPLATTLDCGDYWLQLLDGLPDDFTHADEDKIEWIDVPPQLIESVVGAFAGQCSVQN